MKGLYPKIMAFVGGGFGLTIIAVIAFVYVSESQQIEREGLDRAEALNRMAFEALYASMRQGGDRESNRQVIARLRKVGAFTSLRVVKGAPVIQQFGADPDELPQDGLEYQALEGQEVWQVQEEDGYRLVRYVTPLRVEAECQRCHQAPIGAVNGAIATEISLREFDTALRQRRDVLLLVLGSGLLLLALLTFYALRRTVIRPLQAIQAGATAIAQGDLSHRLGVCTGDELETLAQEFNRMARQLQESYGRIAEEESRVLAAIEASRDAIWVSDAHQRVVMVNSALEQLTGRRREDLLGQTCRYLLGVHTRDGHSICDTLCPFLHPTGNSGGIEGCIPTVSGREIWIEISYGCVMDPDNRLTGVVHIVHDLTERKEIERLKDEFISMVSHELRTPLHHIKGFATTLLQTDVEWDAAAQRDFLGSINREADRLTDLVEKILHLSRLEARELPMEKEWCQASDLIEGALQRRHTLIANRPVEIRLPPDLPPLFVDGREVEVVLVNLIENAAKYSEPGTPITLEVEGRDGQVIFAVTDQGIGIPPEHQARIFERFYRVKEEGHRVAGTGLGLAICKRIVETHGGRLWVKSTPGGGSRFSFSLAVGSSQVA